MEAFPPICKIPPEIVGNITQTLYMSDVLRLLITGNAQLTYLLHKPMAIPKLKAEIGAEVKQRLVSWPAAFNSLRHVLKFSIDSETRIQIPIRDIVLPKTITSLELMGFDTNSLNSWFLNKNSPSLGLMFPNIQSLGMHICLDEKTSDWFSTSPETLTSLKIDEITPDARYPPSITFLRIEMAVLAWVGSRHFFPPNLRVIELNCLQIQFFETFLVCLPSTLESFSFNYNGVYRWYFQLTLKDFSLFPRHLTKLELIHLNLTSEDFSRLPPRLTSLKVFTVPSMAYYRTLPSSITEICVQRIEKTVNLSEIFSSMSYELPLRQLTLCHASPNGNMSIDSKSPINGFAKMPSTLDTLNCPHTSFDLEAIRLIPPSTVRLDLYSIVSMIESLPEWPLLTHLKICYFPLKPGILRSLYIGSPLLQDFQFEDSNSSISYFGSSSILSSGSTQKANLLISPPEHVILSQDIDKIGSKSNIVPFGKYFKSLIALSCQELNDEFLTTVPSSVRQLIMSKANYISDSGVKEHISRLKSLTHLNLGNSPISGQSFIYLPKSLYFFDASKASEVEDVHIGDLPRSLQEIRLNSAISLSNACGAFFPFNLCLFMASENQIITRDILSHMPSQILSSNRQWAVISKTVNLRPSSFYSP